MKKHFLLIAALVSAFTLAACGGGSNDTQEIATENLSVAVTPTTTAALSEEVFTFPAVPALGTTAATSLSFTGTSTTPAFSISSGGNTATGVTTFGSCIFTVSASTFPASHPLAQGKVVTVNPCSFQAATSGVVTGNERNVSATLTLGSTASNPITVELVITDSGEVIINDRPVGDVDTSPTTGAS